MTISWPDCNNMTGRSRSRVTAPAAVRACRIVCRHQNLRRVCESSSTNGSFLTTAHCGAHVRHVLGRSQVVRHRVLIPCTAGSNPAAPANLDDIGEHPWIRHRWQCLRATRTRNWLTISRAICTVPLGRAHVGRFSDGEINVEILENIRGSETFIVQPTCPPILRKPDGIAGYGRRGTSAPPRRASPP